MKKERLAIYTVEIPVRFAFKARADLDEDMRFKAAQEYALLELGDTSVDWKEDDIAIVDKLTLYTAEERAEDERKWREWCQAVGWNK